MAKEECPNRWKEDHWLNCQMKECKRMRALRRAQFGGASFADPVEENEHFFKICDRCKETFVATIEICERCHNEKLRKEVRWS